MAVIKEIIQLGDPLLKSPTKKITNTNDLEIKQTITDLVDSMRQYELLGMAAPQIGGSLRIYVTEVRQTLTRKPDQIDKLRIYINPTITSSSKETVEIYEGCGSAANSKLFGPVVRPKQVTVQALDENGNEFKLDADGLLARVIQHEQDHLDGLEFTDRVTDNSRFMSESEYLKRILNK